MKIPYIPLLSFLFSASIAFSQGWKQIYPPYPAEEYTSIVSIGKDTILLAGLNFTLIRSVDAGAHWERLYNAPGYYDIQRCGYDGSRVWLLPGGTRYAEALAPDTTATGPTTAFLFSVDPVTGDTERIAFPSYFKTRRSSSSLLDLSVCSNNLFVLESQHPHTKILRSADKGSTWSLCSELDSLVIRGGYAICFHDSLQGILIAMDTNDVSRYFLYNTKDGGSRWKRHGEIYFESKNIPRPSCGLPVQWVDDSMVIAVSDHSTLFISRDGGDNWSAQAAMPARVASISMRSSGAGFMLGWNFDIYKTSDFGTTWTKIREKFASGHRYGASCASSDSSFVAASEEGFRVNTTDGGITWNNDRLEPVWYFSHVQFLSDRFGFIDFFPNTVDLPQKSRAVTTDGGHSWREYSYPTNTQLLIHTSPAVAYAFRSGTSQDDTIIMVSRDTCRTWTASFRDTVVLRPYVTDTRVNRGDDTVFVRTSDGILRTYDGGVTWKSTKPGFLSILTPTNSLESLDMSRLRFSWALTTLCLYRSSDNGTTWDSVFTLPAGTWWFYSMNVLDEMQVQIYGKGPCNGCSGVLHSSTDGGSTWTSSFMHGVIASRSPNEVPILFKSGHMMGARRQYEIGSLPGGRPIRFISSQDNWQSYTEQHALSTASPISGTQTFFFLDEQIGWAIAGNRLYETRTGGIDAAEQPPLPGQTSLAQNYPNPFRNRTIIPFRIEGSRNATVRIELFDMMGRKLKTLLDEEVLPGSHTLPFDAAGLAPGIYFTRLVSGARMEVRKLIVAR
jgi:photosystem II stability/assembly factor-like uncharacterized protein